jgi:uncharacterized protein (TIGR00251 family)
MDVHPLQKTRSGWNLRVHAQPKAKRTESCGLHGDAVKIRIASPPVDGKANEELIRFLAGQLHVPKSEIGLIAGSSGRKKVISLPEMSGDIICDVLSLPPLTGFSACSNSL